MSILASLITLVRMISMLLLLVQFINPPAVHKPSGYTHAVKTDGCKLVFLSGQVALDQKGQIVGKGDFKAQAEQVFLNLSAVLKGSGSSFSEVVKLNMYVVGLTLEKRAQLREVRDRFINTAQPPASTLAGVQALALPDYLVEIEAVACAK